MYTEFKATDYPLRSYQQLSTGLAEPQAAALRAGLIDINFNLYAANLPYLLVGSLTACETTTDTITLRFTLVSSEQITTGGTGQGSNQPIYKSYLKLVLTFNTNAAYATTDYVRAYFDLTDCNEINPLITAMDGYICLGNLVELRAAFASNGGVINIAHVYLEPSTVAVIGRHRVDSLVCDYAKPLLLQPTGGSYTDQSAPAVGAIKLEQGANCLITLQAQSNSIVISATKNNNGTAAEKCGKWADRLPSPKDVLCDDAVYSLAGASPDDAGSLEIKGQYPLTVGALSYADLPQAFKTGFLAGSYSHIAKFIVIGTNSSALDPDCSEVPILCL